MSGGDAKTTEDQRTQAEAVPPVPGTASWDLTRCVAVLDLADHHAVHAVAGHRESYRPIRLSADASNAGSVIALTDHYLRLGLRQFYLADLDSLCGREPQWPTLRRILRHLAHQGGIRCWIDLGWTGQESPEIHGEVSRISRQYSWVRWVMASESLANVDALQKRCPPIGTDRMVFSFDFRGGEFWSRGPSLQQWLETVQQQSIDTAIILDVAQVGTASGGSDPMQLCRDVIGQYQTMGGPAVRWISGGGVRNADDVRNFVDAGCDAVLVATAMLPPQD
ncbi:HisA/HisF-related TIM barrel protein [Crateriforma conspicua]|uniref:Histidine biosynthesis protein n=1 Tax=Crateriforma conspicua TaxID=2527996 RepID=A0A5C5Y4B6_9PLAN|nr:HisA/HisF-related TIM barrel protein [Crateriforma conspicua]QDV64181.1 Histidine biosynthesis protein [Crateriforma conspicua]TWT69573.1 Histidine biosynthesis protein [Crateriforma conspicua]